LRKNNTIATNEPVVNTVSVPIRRFSENTFTEAADYLAVEEPLEITVCLQSENGKLKKHIGTTMRTPGHDQELVTGYLFSLGIIKGVNDIISFSKAQAGNDSIEAELRQGVNADFSGMNRYGIMNAACGVCGINSVDTLSDVIPVKQTRSPLLLNEHIILNLPGRIHEHQQLFGKTGGIHAAALFNLKGELVLIREDIGRHNALDKLIGTALSDPTIKMNEHILLLSGRTGFELIQKAGMANIPVVVSVGAPSNISVEMAKDWQITLIGFARQNRFNLYTEFDKWK